MTKLAILKKQLLQNPETRRGYESAAREFAQAEVPAKAETGTKIADLHKEFMQNPDYRREYAKADAEFSRLEARIKAESKR